MYHTCIVCLGMFLKKSLVDISSCIPQSPTLKERSNSPWETMVVIGCLAGFVALENKSNNRLGGRNRSSRVESLPFFLLFKKLRIHVTVGISDLIHIYMYIYIYIQHLLK